MRDAPVAQMDRALASEAKGPAFESRRVYQSFHSVLHSQGCFNEASLLFSAKRLPLWPQKVRRRIERVKMKRSIRNFIVVTPELYVTPVNSK
jgi:hypothetical protein